MGIEVLSFVLTILLFVICTRIYRRWRVIFLYPILTTPILLGVILLVFHIPYERYQSGTAIITHFLQPATVAFAIPLYKNIKMLRRNWAEMLVSIASGAVMAMVTSFFMARVLRLNITLIKSMVPRSITTPIAMDVSNMIGGSAVLTAVFVVVTALTGIVVGPLVIRWMHIKTPVAKGVLFGTGAHAVGTTKAFELGPVEGAMSSVSMIVAAMITLLIAPYLVPIL